MTFRVSHLIDDLGLGGVNRSLDDQLPWHRRYARHEIIRVDAAFGRPPIIEADLVVVHFTASWAKLPFLYALRRQMGTRPIVLQEHSYTGMFEQQFVPSVKRFRRMLRLAYGMADAVVAVSEGQAGWIRAAGLAKSDKLIAIPQALDTSYLEDLPLPDRGRAGPIRFGAYGRYAPQKGFDILVEAFRAIDPAFATLRFAGYGPDEALLRQRAAGLPHVEVGGRIDGPRQFLSEVDAVLIPSRYEAFGLVALEVRAAGRPFIATEVDGLVEQTDPAWAALCRPLDVGSLTQAILSFGDRDVTGMGAAARASMDRSLETNLMRWLSLYENLMGRPATPGLAFCETARPGLADGAIGPPVTY